MKVAVIGAGWAGAAAAYYLNLHHHNVTVYEAARMPGGRARRVESTPFGYPTDNGQHILLGAYRETLTLMLDLGINLDEAFHRIDLCITSANREYHLQAWPLPAPLHLAGGLVGCRGFGINDRYRLIKLTQQLSRKKWQVEKTRLF
ncbi:FAD-dependent oxidoreductase [Paenalcaligenes niemegkensis]|uniref:FAD-dependent oxidoreductase n=1 Tax=Paenalcaligenes niemegkensis TaxID=2895469 RepID=UPI001EE8D346|nr:FAD-dependent oxidoreductase [Paenalcaligenes niemegkensis]MCQ9615632.1 FAD-dependent oxidoreductase [Paenalcaligenes niemegkensis]